MFDFSHSIFLGNNQFFDKNLTEKLHCFPTTQDFGTSLPSDIMPPSDIRTSIYVSHFIILSYE